MTHSILLDVEKPDVRNHNIEKSWNEILGKVLALKPNTNIDFQMLGENVFLISLNKTLDTLWDVLNECDGLSYKYSIFDQEVERTDKGDVRAERVWSRAQVLKQLDSRGEIEGH